MKKTLQQFVTEANLIHKDKYNYSLSNYIDSHTPVIIICPIHGQFLQRPYAHTSKKEPQGCSICGFENRRLPHKKTTEQFIEQAKKKWNYDYSKTVYVSKETKILFECEKHGLIEQKPYQHLKHGCQYCNGRGISKHSLVSFIKIANIVHENKYDYSKTEFVRMSDQVLITCPVHGDFLQRAGNHIHLRNGCPKCPVKTSQPEKEITEYIRTFYDGEIIDHDRKILDGKEIDIYIPELKVGIEYHGIYFHLETIVGKKYHYQKWKLAHDKGITLLQIYGNEWEEKKDIVKSKILNIFKKSDRIFARQTDIVELSRHDKDEFLTKNHIQGSDNAPIHYGLVYKEDIVACMTFGDSRFNRKYNYELVRYCSKNNVSVVGGASKLLSHFRKTYDGSIITYADKRYSDGNLYYKIGFILDGESKPSFSVFNINNNTFHSRLSFKKYQMINFSGYDEKLTAYEIMLMNGYDRIWDCGQYRFVMK